MKIQAILFDLDGTLVKTEGLKSLAYYQAIQALWPGVAQASEVAAAYKAVLGRPRREVASSLAAHFGLEGVVDGVPASERLLPVYLEAYGSMLTDPDRMRDSLCQPTVALLEAARRWGKMTALVSMSSAWQVDRILEITGLEGFFDVTLTGEKVQRTKPDPEIYLLAADLLGVTAGECLVIEDSTVGVRSGLSAGMRCLALATPMTAESLYAFPSLPPDWIVDPPEKLVGMVERLEEEEINRR